MHRGHAWVFRAESHDTMLAWYEDIKNLTEKTGEARNAFVKRHVRSVSGASYRASIDSERALEEDEADETPYMADPQVLAVNTQHNANTRDAQLPRPRPGGSFPSEVHLDRNMVPASPSSSRSPEDQNALRSRVSAPTLEPPYEDQRPVQGTNMPDGPVDDGAQPNSNYAEWTSPTTPTPQRRQASNDRQYYTQPDDQIYRTAETGSQPQRNAGSRTNSTIYIGPVDGGTSAPGPGEQESLPNNDNPATRSQSTLQKPSISRTSTVSDLYLPGRFPVAQNN